MTRYPFENLSGIAKPFEGTLLISGSFNDNYLRWTKLPFPGSMACLNVSGLMVAFG